MVTQLDVITKKYPDVVITCLGDDESRIAVNKHTGEVVLCNSDINCADCIFFNMDDAFSCEDRIRDWLNKEVKTNLYATKNNNNTRNSNGEITW